MLVVDSLFFEGPKNHHRITLLTDPEDGSITIDSDNRFIVIQSGVTRRGNLLIVLQDTKDDNEKTIPLTFQNRIDYDNCLFVLWGENGPQTGEYIHDNC